MSRYWLFTHHKTEDRPQWDEKFMDWLVFQLEKAPSTGKLHWQGYVELKKATRMAKVKDLLQLPGCHLETRKGTAWQATEYCRKQESAVEEEYFCFGTEPKQEKKGQGHRSDLESLAKACQEGIPLAELDKKFPGAMLKFDKHAERMRQRHIKPRTEKTMCICFWGKTGSGKSKKAFELAPNAHWQYGVWWDGYAGHEDVILDDIAVGLYDRQFLLRLFDRYPMQVPYKGGMTHFIAKRLVVTTCEKPVWILEDPEMKRRFELVEEVVAPPSAPQVDPGGPPPSPSYHQDLLRASGERKTVEDSDSQKESLVGGRQNPLSSHRLRSDT